MAKERRVYWRRKGKRIIAEGRKNSRTVYLFTLPEPDELLRLIQAIYEGTPKYSKKASFLTRENLQKNLENIKRLEIKTEDKPEEDDKVLTTKITRTPFQDAKTEGSLTKQEIDEIYSGVEDIFK